MYVVFALIGCKLVVIIVTTRRRNRRIELILTRIITGVLIIITCADLIIIELIGGSIVSLRYVIVLVRNITVRIPVRILYIRIRILYIRILILLLTIFILTLRIIMISFVGGNIIGVSLVNLLIPELEV